MQLFKNKTTRALMLIICALVLVALVITRFYYKNLNESNDPRIVKARILYENYNALAQKNAFDSVFILMDSIEGIYKSIDHYKESYEIGVLYNNRAAAFITRALYTGDTVNNIGVLDNDISLAKKAAEESIEIYTKCLTRFQDKNALELEEIISQDFFIGLEDYSIKQKKKYLKNRIKEVRDSQTETARRLSVSYTNLGIIYRIQHDYESAANSYKKAMDLWDKNLTAENNLNILLGRPIKKRNFIQKLFPANRTKD